ncbi:hypothetical protein [Bdellovibrio sp. HCB274]|uniref:hypothetical protein n=1 Tax=Bdellovibrio sp. HCB274 TaxID=3394361 RepID=UPI0039B6E2A5
MDTPISQGKFSENFSAEKFEDPGIPRREPNEIPGVHEANQKKAEENVPAVKKDWDEPDGEYSAVIDSEGHRVRINHY